MGAPVNKHRCGSRFHMQARWLGSSCLRVGGAAMTERALRSRQALPVLRTDRDDEVTLAMHASFFCSYPASTSVATSLLSVKAPRGPISQTPLEPWLGIVEFPSSPLDPILGIFETN